MRLDRANLCIITDRRVAPGGDVLAVLSAALATLPPGSAIIQVREKDLSGRDLHDLVVAVVALGAPVLVNDRVDVASAAGAAGVHLPENGMPIGDARRVLGPGMVIGASAHSVAGAVEKGAAGADLVILGPIWETPGKGEPVGLTALTEAAEGLRGSTRLFAVGGIDAARARTARRAGAHGVALIRTVMAAADPGAAALAVALAMTTVTTDDA